MSGIEIGWGVDKGIQLLTFSVKLYDALRDENISASQQFRYFAHELADFNSLFTNLIEMLQKYKLPMLIPTSSIELTLRKCQSFLEKYKDLSSPSTGSRFIQGMKHTLTTVKWTFIEQDVAPKLRAELATHRHMIMFRLSTLHMQETMEERVVNQKHRTEMIEMLRMPASHNERLAPIPEIPPNLQLQRPEEPRRRSQTSLLEDIKAFRNQLFAIEHELKGEENKLTDLQLQMEEGAPSQPEMSQTSQTNQRDSVAAFLRIARFDIEDNKERFENFRTRSSIEHPARSNTFDSGIGLSPTNSPDLRASDDTAPHTPVETATFSQLTPSQQVQFNPWNGQSIPGSQNGRPDEEHESATPSLHASRARRNSFASSSYYVRQALQQFRAELDIGLASLPSPSGHEEEMISPVYSLSSRTESIRDQIPRSPTQVSPNVTPELRSEPLSSAASTHTSFQPSPALTGASGRRDSGHVSIGNSAWKYLASRVQVSIDRHTKDCGACVDLSFHEMQTAERHDGGCSIRVVCCNPAHSTQGSFRTVIRQDLSSSTIAYPHVFHTAADPESIHSVLVKGKNSRLERSQSESLGRHNEPLYTFANADDSKAFQEHIYGHKLLSRFNLKSVDSSDQGRGRSSSMTVRIWQNHTTGDLSLMTFGALIGGHEPIHYCERQAAFSEVKPSGRDKLKMFINHSTPRSRRNSGFNGLGTRTDEISHSVQRLKWVTLQFESTTDRESFLEIWRNGS